MIVDMTAMVPWQVEVLLVEDSDTDARLIIEALSDDADFAPVIRQVPSLTAALAAIEGSAPDVILYDLNLPDAHGVEGLETLALQAPDVPVVVLTWSDDDEVAVHAIRLRAQDYVVKNDLVPARIRRVVRNALERQRLLRELEALDLTDEVTGAYNRRALQLLGETRIRDARRSGRPILLTLISVNEGRRADTDWVLRLATSRLSEVTRESDILARVGDDQLVLLMLGNPDGHDTADAVQRRVSEALSCLPDPDNAGPALSFRVLEWSVDREANIRQLLHDIERGLPR